MPMPSREEPKQEQVIDFDRLRERLLQGGIAPRHVRRTIAEIRDHFEDGLRDEQAKGLNAVTAAQAAWKRLGDEDTLARSILARTELHSLPARYPRSVLGAGPLLLWLGAIVVTMLAIGLLENILRAAGLMPPPGPDPLWLYGPFSAVLFFYFRLLPLIIGLAMVVAAIRQRLTLWAPIMGAGLVSIFAGTTHTQLTFSTKVGERGELEIGNPLLAALAIFSDAFGTATAAEIYQGLGIAALNLAIILTPYLIWLKRYRLGPA